MPFSVNLLDTIELLQFPFMQRALLGGVLVGGLLGSFTVLRQLSFFSEALGDAALLGVSLGLLFGLNPSLVLLPFAIVFALAFSYLLEHSKIWTDALLNILCSSSLALAIIILSFTRQYKGNIDSLLFGDILGIQSADITLAIALLIICIGFVGLTLRTQMMLILNESMAIAQGISASAHRTAFIVLLSLVVGVSIKAVGVLLVSAFVVIPACAARLLSRNFTTHVLTSAGLGAISAVFGIILSALFNLPSGPSIVMTQLALFLLTLLFPRANHLAFD